jgi:hypothetical protein
MVPGTNVLELFYRGTGNALWSRWLNRDESWSNAVRMSGALNGDPIAAVVS